MRAWLLWLLLIGCAGAQTPRLYPHLMAPGRGDPPQRRVVQLPVSDPARVGKTLGSDRNCLYVGVSASPLGSPPAIRTASPGAVASGAPNWAPGLGLLALLGLAGTAVRQRAAQGRPRVRVRPKSARTGSGPESRRAPRARA